MAGAEHADEESPESGATEAAAVQERLRKWAEKELLTLRIRQAERTAVLLGDGVYVLAWNLEKRRPALQVYDPGFFFPRWGGDQDQDFPSRVQTAGRSCSLFPLAVRLQRTCSPTKVAPTPSTAPRPARRLGTGAERQPRLPRAGLGLRAAGAVRREGPAGGIPVRVTRRPQLDTAH
ncbi:hypothetical protein [Streptomyces sp. KR55]|uniref:hypothetical protein n=1 Tax=Streptomyces sp. KR55 TaxID=3457425 RepID=UPI003FD14F0D